jgi:anti-sigma regulatory factor (Ser/Thr protein kinase)
MPPCPIPLTTRRELANFTLKGCYEDRDLDLLCNEVGAAGEESKSDATPHIDLRAVGTLGPSALAIVVGTACAVAAQASGRAPITIYPPDSGEAPRCLQADPLRHLIESGLGHWHTDDGGEMIGVEVFSSAEGIDRVIASFQQHLALNSFIPDLSLRSLRKMVTELAENVIQHAEACRGVVVLRLDPAAETFSIAIYDDGIGIRRSLIQNPKFQDLNDDLTAIVTSMGAGSTAEPGTGGGMGLFIARLVLRDNGGTLTIRSGDARREEGDEVSDSKLLPSLAGTLVAIRAHVNRPFDYARIEEALGQPAGVSDRHPYQAGPAT